MQVHASAALTQSAARIVEAPQPQSNVASTLGAIGVPSGNAVPTEERQVSSQELTEAVGSINMTMQSLGQNLEFTIDTESKRTVVKVIDQNTQELIRQMPTAEALEIARALDRVQGLLIRQRA